MLKEKQWKTRTKNISKFNKTLKKSSENDALHSVYILIALDDCSHTKLKDISRIEEVTLAIANLGKRTPVFLIISDNAGRAS